MVYEIDYDSIILSKESTYDYIPNNLVYLLIKDYSDNADDLGRSKNSWPYKEYIFEPYLIILRRTTDTARCVISPYQ